MQLGCSIIAHHLMAQPLLFVASRIKDSDLPQRLSHQYKETGSMVWKKQAAIYVCSTAFLFLTAACEQEGPAERAGKQIDNAAEELNKAVTKPEGPLEAAGKKIDKAVEETGEAVEEATK
jgi:hypothetical protein